jgi:hypothetical protein
MPPNTCSEDLTSLQGNLIQKYNQYIQKKDEQSRIDWVFALKCMTDYLENHKANPEMNYDTLLRTYYHTIMPMRNKIHEDQVEIERMHGMPHKEGDPETRLEVEKQQYDGVVYTRILLTTLATVLLYYILLNLMKSKS